jgi:hypothetical protein
MVKTAFADKRAYLDREARRIYLNVSGLLDKPQLRKPEVDRLWHSLDIVIYPANFDEVIHAELTPCLAHNPKEPAGGLHAILIDPSFLLNHDRWLKLYQAIEGLTLQSSFDAQSVYRCSLEPESIINRDEQGKPHYGRVVKFDRSFTLEHPRRALRYPFSILKQMGEQKRTVAKPIRRRRRVRKPVEQVAPTEHFQAPPSPPETDPTPSKTN